MAALGFWSRSSRRAKDREVTVSPSRLRAGPSSRRICITPARTTEGAKPVRAIKASTSGMDTMAIIFLRRLRTSMAGSITTMLMCMPDTATTWARPQRLRAV